MTSHAAAISNDVTLGEFGAARGRSVLLADGGGGQLTDNLIASAVLPRLGNPALNALLDSAILPAPTEGALALTIDGYVVQPWRFPGGDVGRLAVCGTVNDLVVCGARPIGLALGLIIEEGFARADLDVVLESISAAAEEAGVSITTGDTKVVARGQADGIYITTAGVGATRADVTIDATRVEPGDVVIVNGPIGEHGLAVMLRRELPEITSVVRSDVAPLNGLIDAVLDAAGDGVTFMRDATRGGLSGVVSDLAQRTGWRVTLEQDAIAVRPEAQHAADMLGLDPLDVANEGKAVFIVRAAAAAALRAMRSHARGRDATRIGWIDNSRDGVSVMRTSLGGERIVHKPYGEQLPRIC